jgi:hypothetical protein
MDLEEAVKKGVAEGEAIVNLMLRYILSGAVAVLAFGFLRGSGFAFLIVGKEKAEVSWLLTSVLMIVIGVALYSFHKSLPHVFIFRLILQRLIRNNSLQDQIADLEDRLATARFERRAAKHDPLQRRIDALIAETHFLYVSGWALLGAVAATQLLGTTFGRGTILALAIFAVVFVAALNHHWNTASLEVSNLPNK